MLYFLVLRLIGIVICLSHLYLLQKKLSKGKISDEEFIRDLIQAIGEESQADYSGKTYSVREQVQYPLMIKYTNASLLNGEWNR